MMRYINSLFFDTKIKPVSGYVIIHDIEFKDINFEPLIPIILEELTTIYNSNNLDISRDSVLRGLFIFSRIIRSPRFECIKHSAWITSCFGVLHLVVSIGIGSMIEDDYPICFNEYPLLSNRVYYRDVIPTIIDILYYLGGDFGVTTDEYKIWDSIVPKDIFPD